MKHWKILLVALLILAMNLATTTISHKAREIAQHNTRLYDLMLIHDAHAFMTAGGGNFGYQNYFKWQYAKALQDPQTPLFTKILFWQRGLFYDAADPPNQYQYPPLYKKESWRNLPNLGIVWHPAKLPDGHYTVAKILNSGGAVVIQHLPLSTSPIFTNFAACQMFGRKTTVLRFFKARLSNFFLN